MNGPLIENWEERLLAAARELPYPPTPDIAAGVTRRLGVGDRGKVLAYPRVAWALAAVIVLLLATILLVPPVRAAVLDFLQLGAVRIFLVEPDATPTMSPSQTPDPSASTQPTPRPTRTPLYLASLLDLEGEMPLEEAVERLSIPLSLPAFPSDLGLPDHAYLQDQDDQFLILVWTDPQDDSRVLLSLHAIGPNSWAITKMSPAVVGFTQVNGREALWAEGPYPMVMTRGRMDIRRLVAGHVLIWEHDGVTYRLESDLPMGEAVKIAESLQPYQP
jgi:hypothetical protein